MMHIHTSLTCDRCGARTEYAARVRRVHKTWGDSWSLVTNMMLDLPRGWLNQLRDTGDPVFFCSQRCMDEQTTRST